jgi:Zn finger protein HypA/HybF involved in hydrogenase expression
MYQFECPKGHKSYSASKEQHDPACPTCGEPTHLVTADSQDRVTPKVEE